MKAVSYTLLFAILSPGLLLLVPPVFKAVLKNPLSFLAIVLNIALFYMVLTNIKYIPYLNTLEGFQDDTPPDTSIPTIVGPPTDSNGNTISEACMKCAQKCLMFSVIGPCDSACYSSTHSAECISCHKNTVPGIIKKQCSNKCTPTEMNMYINNAPPTPPPGAPPQHSATGSMTPIQAEGSTSSTS